jgi:dihydropteroate synthase
LFTQKNSFLLDQSHFLNPKDTSFYQKTTLQIKGKLFDLSEPKVMGILNITPDSFYDGGKHSSIDKAVATASQMLDDGADIIDVGGYSTRPNASEVSETEEAERVIPTIKAINEKHPNAIISVDTFRSYVAKQAIEVGAAIVNDVSGGNLDENMFALIAEKQVPYVLMHMRGTPENMQQQTQYDDLLVDVVNELSGKLRQLKALGVNDIIIDPGFGFAKSIDQNYEILQNLAYLEILEAPLLVGVSRKSMIYKVLVLADEALNGTSALNMVALMNGASILRVHDVKEVKEIVELYKKLKN